MNILVVGGGGREHSLAWKLSESNKVQHVYVAPGNGGTATEKNITNLDLTDIVELRKWVQANEITLTVVGPEGALASGIVDEFRSYGLRIFGPTKAAAQLESSKAFSKAFMKRHKIPTAEYEIFTDPFQAHAYIDEKGVPIVIKADGLAAGKGVVVATTIEEAHKAIDFMLIDNVLGVSHNEAGACVVIEEFLDGEEASFIIMCDGKNIQALATSQDHKRLLDGDLGPNTGGMGAYSPAPVVTPDIYSKVMREIISPTIKGMEEDGITFTGFLYAGLMIDSKGVVKTLEFNCRMGDPETQPIMMRLKNDLLELLLAATSPGSHGSLDKIQLEWDRRSALGVVIAAEGYPLNPRKGDQIIGLPVDREDLHVFHAGTQLLDDNKLITSGGRVLCVTVLAESIKQAQNKAYEVAQTIDFDGAQFRRDIGYRASLKR